MRKIEKNILFIMLMSMFGTNIYAAISVENADGIMICYNYINDGKELEVTFGGYEGNIVIPEEVTFMNRTRKVTSIGDQAFYCCYGLKSVTIPQSVTSIGYDAFRDCSGLTSVYINDIAAWCNILFRDNPLRHAHHLFMNGEEINDLIILNSVTSIRDGAFFYCSGLNSVTIGNNVTSIGNQVFYHCSGLKSVTIPHNVTSIGDYTFSGCSGLTSVTILDGVMSIGIGAFNL